MTKVSHRQRSSWSQQNKNLKTQPRLSRSSTTSSKFSKASTRVNFRIRGIRSNGWLTRCHRKNRKVNLTFLTKTTTKVRWGSAWSFAAGCQNLHKSVKIWWNRSVYWQKSLESRNSILQENWPRRPSSYKISRKTASKRTQNFWLSSKVWARQVLTTTRRSGRWRVASGKTRRWPKPRSRPWSWKLSSKTTFSRSKNRITKSRTRFWKRKYSSFDRPKATGMLTSRVFWRRIQNCNYWVGRMRKRSRRWTIAVSSYHWLCSKKTRKQNNLKLRLNFYKTRSRTSKSTWKGVSLTLLWHRGEIWASTSLTLWARGSRS